jgi:uncharacterized protein
MSSSEKKSKPVPNPSRWSAPFWEAARDGRLIIQRCSNCGEYVFYPRLACPHCFSEELSWEQASGKGKVYSFSVVTNNAPSDFIEDMPYIVAIIELEEGVRLLSNIVEADPLKVRCEMPVEVVFEAVNEEFRLPRFKPLEG